MGNTYDAKTLVSPSHFDMENIYADFANSMKALANNARIEMINTPNLQQNKKAKEIYAKEVASLDRKLKEAKINSIKEREAKRKTASYMNEKKEVNPDLKGEDLRKLTQRTLDKYRQEVGAIPKRKRDIKLEEREWQAIQAGAISENKLKQILNNSDPDVLRDKAMPRTTKGFTSSQLSIIKRLDANGFTLQEIANKFHVSTSTISNVLKGVN